MDNLKPLKNIPGHYVNAEGLVVTVTGEPSAIQHLAPGAVRRYTTPQLRNWQANVLAAIVMPVLSVCIVIAGTGAMIWLAIGMSFQLSKTLVTGGNPIKYFKR